LSGAERAAFRVFLLSPADCAGTRARMLQRPAGLAGPGRFDRAAGVRAGVVEDLVRRLGGDGAPLGEVFAFVSSLYFRGKLAYARAFARPPAGLPGVQVITPGDGLRAPETILRAADLRRYAGVDVDAGEPRYTEPLRRDLHGLAAAADGAEYVLLGSVASTKYVELLTSVLGARVAFPVDFLGRGDMSRGGLMLRSVEDGRELPYAPLLGAARHGPRPPRLPPAARPTAGRR
jgi:hypothetical protein